MAKAKRGLLFSLLTLLIAVAITATSTYAWFVVNTEVTASNMQVEVKSDTTYLVISGTSTLGTDVTYEATASSAKVLPVRYNASATPESGYEKWETAAGTSYTNGAALNNAYSAVATANVTNYYVAYDFYVGLTATTANDATALRVKSMAVTKATEQTDTTMKGAVSALVRCQNDTDSLDTYVNYVDIDSIADYTPTATYANLAATVHRTHVYHITVYVYINGDNAAVTSSNAANLGAFKLAVTFQITQGA